MTLSPYEIYAIMKWSNLELQRRVDSKESTNRDKGLTIANGEYEETDALYAKLTECFYTNATDKLDGCKQKTTEAINDCVKKTEDNYRQKYY